MINLSSINAGIVGATGHTGEELIGLLLNHPQVKISKLYSTSDEATAICDVFPKFKNRIDLVCKKPDIKEIAVSCDLIFLALPHSVSFTYAPLILGLGKRVIDLSADYRFKDAAVYEKFYNVRHKDTANLKISVYGLPEIYREQIKSAKLVANPGCYSTCAILGLAPLLALNIIEFDSIIIDAKSGVSGAGKKQAKEYLFSEVSEDFKPYKVNTHRHIPEIKQVLSKLAGRNTDLTFVPHLLPLNRGILETIYVTRKKTARSGKLNLINLYKKFYKSEPFIRIKKEGEFPRIKDVCGTNFCDIGIREDGKTIIIIAGIDNLLKGASGQAVQNMNIMYKFPETLGLF